MSKKEILSGEVSVPNAKRPVAYSYVRFSTKKQELGDSLRRQVEAAQRYAREHNLQLSERTFRDLGVSGFKQRNVKQGALAAFIGAVKTGLIAPGSYLLIEQFDRLSRAEINIAFRLLLDLVDLDITVITLVDEKVWNTESVQDVANVLTSIILMSRAHEESKAKAKRLSEVWGQKKLRAGDKLGEDGVRNIVTRECPRWLEPNADKTAFVVLADKADSVKKVFQARINGFGVSSIQGQANKGKWPVPGKRAIQQPAEDDASYSRRISEGFTWHTSTVSRLLHNRAVLGEYQPFKTEHVKVKDQGDKKIRVPVGEPIKGYYPAIIDETTFLRSQAKTDRSGRFPGRRDASLKNWLQGILRCSCGRSMVRKNKNSLAQPGYARYYCTGRNSKVTKCPGASALEMENAVLEVVSQAAPQYFEGTARTESLKSRVELLELDLSAAKQTRDHYVEAIGLAKGRIDALMSRLEAEESKIAGIETELRMARAELVDLTGDFDTIFENIRKAVKSVDSLEARAALREDLSRVIDKAVVHQVDGYIQVYIRGESAPIVQLLRDDGNFPGAQVVGRLQLSDGHIPGQKEGMTIALLTREEQDAYVEMLDERGE